MKKRFALGLAAALVLLAAMAIVSTWTMTTRSGEAGAEPSSLDPRGVGASGDVHARAARDPHDIDAGVSAAVTARAPGAPGAEPGGSSDDRSPGHSTSNSTSTAPSPRTPAPSGAAAARPSRLPDGGALPGGALDPEQIRDVVRNAIPELRFCFEWQLSRHPDLAGRVTLEFRIAEDGTVEEPDIAEDELGDETVLRCFRGVTGRMRFPPPEGGPVTVRYPITLSPGDEPPTPPTESPERGE